MVASAPAAEAAGWHETGTRAGSTSGFIVSSRATTQTIPQRGATEENGNV
jgi:hypothetical protein